MLKTILILEDDQRLAQHWQAALENEGFQVIIQSDAEQAIATLKKTTVDIVISDLLIRDSENRPMVKGGLSLLSCVALLQKRPKPKVIAVTGTSAELNLNGHAESLKASLCLTKPLELDELTNAVHELLAED